MASSLKKRGQKLAKKFSRASLKASEESREHIKENLFERVGHIQNIRLLIFEWVLLITALVMLSIAQAFWFGDSYAEDVFVEGGNYVEATIGRVNSLNPLFATTSSEKTLSRLLFATLATVDYSGHPGLGLASNISASEDGKVWTVRLREGLKWSDGTALTHADVLFTVDLIQNPAVNSIYNSNFEGVKVAAEGKTLIFTLPSAYADFITALEIPILPEHILKDVPVKNLVEAEFSNNPVGSGAFALNAVQSSTGEDERVFYLSSNPYYYLGAPMLNSFAVHTYANKELVISAVNAGAVTATAELSGLDAEKVTAANFNKKDSGLRAGAFMFFNLSNRYLSDTALRRAIRNGIDLTAIRAAAPGTAALDFPILKEQMELSTYPELTEYNREASAYQIAEIASGDTIALNVVTVNAGYLPAVAEKIAAELRALGIYCEVTTYAENQDFITNIISKRNYDILVYEIELGADPDPLPYYHSSQANSSGLNLANYRNVLVDDLLIGARETMDVTLRARKYENFLSYWYNDVPAVGLYQPNMTYVYNKNVRPYGDVSLVVALDRFSDVTNWAANKGSKNRTP